MSSLLPSRSRSFPKFLVLAALLVGLCARAHAWWDAEWTLRKQITLDTTTVDLGGETVRNFPVLVRLHEGNLSFASLKQDGTDLRFVAADDKTLLPFHIEKIDLVLNEAFVWVKVPEIKSGAKTTFWLYYGNSGNKATKAEDAKATYDDTTVAVYHFGEKNQPAFDSSGNGNTTMWAGTGVEGAMIGGGVRLDGKTGLEISSAPSTTHIERGPFTWSAWFRLPSVRPLQVLFSRRDGLNGFLVELENGSPVFEIVDANGTHKSTPGAVATVNTWHHLAVVSSGDQTSLYVDGESVSSLPLGIPALNTTAYIGNDPKVTGIGYAGELDELSISNGARTKGYVRLLAATQGAESAGKLISVGADEQDSSWLSALKGGYMGVIIGSLTVDGWVVIGILLVMSGISWIVMITKGGYLNKIAKGNTAFLEQWEHVANDLSVLDNDNADNAASMGGRLDPATAKLMRNSPLYKVYHVGMEEIRHRVAADDEGQGGGILKARSLHAIRATLDGTLTRESQRLSSGMVLLTIAISGGPFLGLLGTVVGVMITFAAVAQAGEVNVNAIAPGIAAALAATVAGLAVAIPALFGYNYLLTRIKQATTDMHVFIDEFVTKLAEFYSDAGE